ncbi:MAG: fatty acid desaturase [Gammaproteobacteria bacterium]|jgi:stearoyl-CoA desaturase (delta-9 desaturase)|nr:fatty acid desaturase [Gammaproteobacteria bacterium]MBU0785428.1 fatty acid desaturase [Gammaproteobacteria bacterium]MBU0813629.1 fatty acid desaturase [Gammaproteobacteria bacterium]MBU1788900.1 fatty acid desaturase [Gammaproteobacteria bacterium]
MLLPDWTVLNAAIEWLSHGMWDLAWWQIVLFTLAMTHVTMISVTVFLHRHQAHRALDLHPIASHFFRFWLWMTTGQVTKEWAAIHRKHHAKCEQADDPHSPHVYGIKTVLLQGAELYRAESKNKETLARYGHGTPDDWLERNLYTRYSWQGVGLMMIIDLTLFGAAGLAVWAVQMAWTPIMAAGIINGAAHFWGYRNFEAPDASTNISPWGIIIAGEELHNNHHTYPTSAKLSVKPYEFDIGWMYISLMQMVGLAKVKKTPPKLAFGDIKPVADEKTLEALIANRYEIMAGYAKGMQQAFKHEVEVLKTRSADASVIKAANRWLHRDADKVPASAMPELAKIRAASPVLDMMVSMREELRQLWLNTSLTRDQLLANLQAWCRRAEESGIAALREFSLQLRAARV